MMIDSDNLKSIACNLKIADILNAIAIWISILGSALVIMFLLVFHIFLC